MRRSCTRRKASFWDGGGWTRRTLTLREPGLTPERGKKAMHVEFTADGGQALVSVWHREGAVVVYDSSTLEEVARLPYDMPIGKYNAFNKTRLMR